VLPIFLICARACVLVLLLKKVAAPAHYNYHILYLLFYNDEMAGEVLQTDLVVAMTEEIK
jgi:hypothetical protein